MKITLGNRQYQTRGISGLLGTILIAPALGVAASAAVIAVGLALPGILVGMIGAERIN